MTREQAAAFVNAQSICALAKIEGMKSDNAYQAHIGMPPRHNGEDFEKVPDEFGLGHNTVLQLFEDVNRY